MSSSSTPRQQRIQFILGLTDNQESRVTRGQLPDLALVREDIARVPGLEESVSMTPADDVIFLQNSRTGEIVRDPIPRSLVFNAELHKLFKYSFLIHLDDVPNDILESVVWALEQFVDVLTECTDAQLVAFGHIVRAEDSSSNSNGGRAVTQSRLTNNGRLFMRLQAKAKLTMLLLKPELNRPGDAAKFIQEIIEYVCSNNSGGQILRTQRDLLLVFAEALARGGEDDVTAETLLERLADSPASNADGLLGLVKAKIFLSRVQRRRGKPGAAKKQEKWLVKWFKKNPHLLPETILRELLMPVDEPVSPILEALGGPSWLEGREHTDKTDHRLVMQCRQCFSREPMVKLFVCSKCKKIYYCSRECQKKDWPLHKDACKDIADLNKKIELLSLTNSSAAQREKDWNAWRDAVDQWPYVNALRLHENPDRARTHLIVEQSVYAPNAGPLAKDKFKIVKCAVVRMADAYSEIERTLQLNRGEGREYCEGLLRDQPQVGIPLVSFVILRFGEGVTAWLDRDTIMALRFEQTPYNRNWREEINKESPPTTLVLGKDIKDAEFD
ncbi:uncharacterized protein C8Q71DRAFT_440672 [Rhodofomes roseus]|uniref:MYND-type domain-containing protein n=1 Tax=Rhodofomes roseus TaxID=34475 RepID=A0ABQ8KRV4_9APHY|nr:uncharacterized protein C8Q71DRAFT_440672 [Rhodofomes roseus]KAH9841137.1 hypothetical protein C8Q71DRAFT_440672 [Rhodofomes roseus]